MNTQQLSKKIRDRQMVLDHQAVRRNKHTQISPHSPIHDTSLILDHPEPMRATARSRNEQYGCLLKEQMTVNRIEEQAQAGKIRRAEIQDASYYRQKYPFGFEGVKVCEGVIEKYKASNYVIQKNMLQQFEREAEEFRRNRNNRHCSPSPPHPPSPHSHTLPRFTEPLRDLDNFSFLKAEEQARRQRVHQLELMKQEQQKREQRRRKEYQKQIKRKNRNEFYLRRQKENFVKIGNMLREIDHKLKENSSKLGYELKELRKQLKSQTKFKNVSQENLLKIANRITEQSESCSKIPVVMYNSQLCDSRVHYQEADMAPRIDRDAFGKSSEHISDVIRILRKNEQRLKMLTQDSEGKNDKRYI